MSELPFEIPPFDPGHLAPKPRFDWWGWHPNYPTWSRSCWGGTTMEEALAAKARADARFEFDTYAVKLVKEDCGVFTVLQEEGPESPEVWQRIFDARTGQHCGEPPDRGYVCAKCREGIAVCVNCREILEPCSCGYCAKGEQFTEDE